MPSGSDVRAWCTAFMRHERWQQHITSSRQGQNDELYIVGLLRVPDREIAPNTLHTLRAIWHRLAPTT